MKKFYFSLALNCLFGGFLVFGTVASLLLIRSAGHSGFGEGWALFSPVAAMTGMALIIWLIILFAVDFFWALFFVLWLVKKRFHIREDDHTLYLP